MENCLERMDRIDAKRKIADFMVKEKMPYSFKKKYAAIRAREFVSECAKRELNYHVSVGGLDSITLFLFLKSIGIDAPGISVSFLEDSSIQKVHRQLGIECLRPAVRSVDDNGKERYWSKQEILQEFGFPVLSKEIAAKIETLANPTEKNRTVRHAIVTGETGAYGGYQKNSRMKMSQKWLEKFGGYANEEEGTEYQTPDFKVSSKCCYYLKEKPCDLWAKEHNSVPFLGLMASEGGRRAKSLRITGATTSGPLPSALRLLPYSPDKTCCSLPLIWKFQYLRFTGPLNGKTMEPFTPQRHKEPDAPCADSASTWRSDPIVLTSSKSAIPKSGTTGCMSAAPMPMERNSGGPKCWTISALGTRKECNNE